MSDGLEFQSVALIIGCAAGLADPGPVAAALWPDEEIESSVRLDAIVSQRHAT